MGESFEKHIEEIKLVNMIALSPSKKTKEQKEEEETEVLVNRLPESVKKHVTITAKDFVKSVYTIESDITANNILNQIQAISACVKAIWKQYLWLAGLQSKRVLETLREKFVIEQKFGLDIFCHKSELPKLAVLQEISESPYKNSASIHTESVEKWRKKISASDLINVLVQDESIFGKLEEVPIIVEENYLSKIDESHSISLPTEVPDPLNSSDIILDTSIQMSKPPEEKKQIIKKPIISKSKLFIMVHGFQGTSFDLKTIRNRLLMRYPDAKFLISSENENCTDNDIKEQGIRLAAEISKFIKRYYRDPNTLGKIIFIGHSLGGIVIRAALPLLEIYKSKMHTFITFSSPHLGCYYLNSSLIGAGLWFLQKWNKSESLRQLTFQDKENQRDCFMFNLSEQKVFF